MQKSIKIAISAGCFLYFFIALLYSQNVYAYKMAYTIQTGSFLSVADARKQFALVADELHDTERDYLRIEKIGKYYSLRLGKFDDRASAEDLFAKVKKKFSTAIVMNAYIKDERIVNSYGVSAHKDMVKIEEKTSLRAPFPSDLIYSIQTGSFSKEKTAQKQFDLIMSKLDSGDLDFLRIEKIGKFYCLRAGNFNTRAAAAGMFKKIRAILPKAVIVDAYIKESRIVKLYRQASFVLNQTAKVNAAQERKIPAVKPEIMNEVHKEGQTGVSEDQKGHEVIKNEKKPLMQDETVPDLFFSYKKPPVTANIRKKISPNNERKGDMYINKKQYFKALDEYRRAPYKRPILRRKLAMLLYKMGFVDEAISEIEGIIESSPAASSDRMMLGTLYLAKGNEAGARESFIAALEINPGNTYAYYYLSELFLREKDYDMAWLSVKMARYLGYEEEGLISRLRAVSTEPDIDPLSVDKEGLSLRLILVNTYKQAREILDRISGGELFEEIASKESVGPGRNAGGFMGRLSPSEVGSEIAAALQNQAAFAGPVIVKTRNGFHIVQRIAPFDISSWKKMLADNGKANLLSANDLK